jgi:hypothetical protein
MAKTRSGGLGTTLILAPLLVIVSAVSGTRLVCLIWYPTEPQVPTVVQGIHRVNDLTRYGYTKACST